MALGTQNRLQRAAAACRQHLHSTFPTQTALVNEFIAEIEGSEADPAAWNRFSDLKRSQAEMRARAEDAFRVWLN